jgi:hypothetical protein
VNEERQVLPTSFRPPPRVHRRRSQRILLAVPVLISGQRRDGSALPEHTATQIVNALGALILLREPVFCGQKLQTTHLATSEEIACTVIDIHAPTAEIPETDVSFSKPSPPSGACRFPPRTGTLERQSQEVPPIQQQRILAKK